MKERLKGERSIFHLVKSKNLSLLLLTSFDLFAFEMFGEILLISYDKLLCFQGSLQTTEKTYKYHLQVQDAEEATE